MSDEAKLKKHHRVAKVMDFLMTCEVRHKPRRASADGVQVSEGQGDVRGSATGTRASLPVITH